MAPLVTLPARFTVFLEGKQRQSEVARNNDTLLLLFLDSRIGFLQGSCQGVDGDLGVSPRVSVPASTT